MPPFNFIRQGAAIAAAAAGHDSSLDFIVIDNIVVYCSISENCNVSTEKMTVLNKTSEQ